MFRTPTKAQRAAASIAALLITATVMSAAGSRAGNAPLTATALPKNGAHAIVKFRYRTDGGGNGTGIFVVAPDGSGAHWFTSGRGLDPSWSPDGKTLFFTRRQETELWIADQHGRHQTKIESVSSSGPGLFYPGDWSPDGSQSVGWRDPGLYTARSSVRASSSSAW